MAEVAELPEGGEAWSWRKFFGGFFNGLNTAKAITTTFHQILVLTIVVSVIWLGIGIWKHFHSKKSTPPVPPISISTNNGKVSTSSDDRRKTCLFLNLCF